MMIAGLLGALAPDLDVIARIWDPMAAIAVHRTATHSFTGGAIVAFAAAGLVWGFDRQSFLKLLSAAYLGLLSHMGLDLLTSFGVAVLWPITERRFSLAQHYLIDPIFSALVLGFLIATFWFKGRRTLLSKIALVSIVLYASISGAQKSVAISRWQVYVDSQEIKPIRSVVLPLFPGPFRWLGVSETENGFYEQSFWLYGSNAVTPRFFSKTNADLRDVEHLREVQVFLSFARFPWKQELYDRGLRVIEYRDLAFADHPLGILGGPLSLRIWIDEANSVRKMEFGHRF